MDGKRARAQTVERDRSEGRLRAFRVVATIMAASAVAFGLATGGFGILGEGQAVHAFHNLAIVALLLVLSAPAAIAAARVPERAGAPLVHLGAVATAGLATMALAAMVDVYTAPFVVFVAVLFVLRAPRGPVFGEGRPSVALGALVAVATVPLIAYALGQAELQRIDTSSEHAELNHWVEMSFYAVAVLLLGVLASLRPHAFRASAWSAGGALAILGGASLLLQSYASAFDAPWAWAALLGGIAFVAISEWEARPASARGFTRRQTPALRKDARGSEASAAKETT